MNPNTHSSSLLQTIDIPSKFFLSKFKHFKNRMNLLTRKITEIEGYLNSAKYQSKHQNISNPKTIKKILGNQYHLLIAASSKVSAIHDTTEELKSTYIKNKSKYLNDTKYYLAVAYFKRGDWKTANSHIEDFISNLTEDNEFLEESLYLQALSHFGLDEYNSG